MQRTLFYLLLVALASLWICPRAKAEIYRFVDKDGVVHFSNMPDDPRYKPIDGRRKKKTKSRKKKKVSRKKYKKKSTRARRIAARVVNDYDEMIAEASLRFNIPVPLIRAVIAVESNYNSKAVSHAGAQGLMQLMPPTAADMGVKDSFDPRQNILGGTRYLRLLANMFDGDLVLTLAGYNAGQKAVVRHNMDIPPFDETQRYVRRVLQLYYHYKKQKP